jgi:hypothetical protein
VKATHAGIREVLRTCGPLTSREVAAFFPASDHRNVSAMLSNMRRLATKQVYIARWTRDSETQRGYPSAVFALGARPCARKLAPFTNAERCSRWRARQALGRGVPNSVFALGAGA